MTLFKDSRLMRSLISEIFLSSPWFSIESDFVLFKILSKVGDMIEFRLHIPSFVIFKNISIANLVNFT